MTALTFITTLGILRTELASSLQAVLQQATSMTTRQRWRQVGKCPNALRSDISRPSGKNRIPKERVPLAPGGPACGAIFVLCLPVCHLALNDRKRGS